MVASERAGVRSRPARVACAHNSDPIFSRAKGPKDMMTSSRSGRFGVRTLAAVVLAASGAATHAQELAFRFEAATDQFTPLHSYAYAKIPGYKFFFGGISGQGLHSIPEATGTVSFPLNVFNENVYMLDEGTNTLYSASIASLSQANREMLRFTTAQFVQIGDTLHLYVGYGALENGTQWTTKPSVMSVDLLAVKNAMLASNPLNDSMFTMQASTQARVAGGIIVKLGDKFALVGGSNFTGDYGLGVNQTNPFQNQYSRAIYIFDPAVSMTTAVESFFDAYAFRRRDGNVMPVTLPDGNGGTKPGFVYATGVFRNGFDIWEEPLLYGVGDSSVHFEQTFLQKANQYETANVSLYSETLDTNRIVTFGGITYFFWDEKFGWFQDFSFPWTDQVAEYSITNGQFVMDSEIFLGRTPLPFTNTHMLLQPNIPHNENGQVLLDDMPHNEILVGKIYGGLFAQEPSTSPVTFASSTVYNVYMTVGVRGDVNKDGYVNFTDLNAILSQFGGPGFADMNLDGVVNFNDLNVVLSNFGASAQ